MLHRDVGGLLAIKANHHQIKLIDQRHIVDDQLHPIIAAVHLAPQQQPGIHHQVVAEAGIGFRKHHSFSAAGEIFDLQDRHAIAFAGRDHPHFRHHHQGGNPLAVSLLREAAQANGHQQPAGVLQLLEWMIGEVEAHQLFLQPQLLGGCVVGHGRRFGGRGWG